MSNLQSSTTVCEGDVLAGKYRIDRILGKGGMGVVVAAHHIHLDEKVAIKFLLPETLGNQEAVARFAREARAAVKIKSEHVARVSDVGTLDNGAPYMVMEYLDGGDLADWLRKRGPLPSEQAVEFLLQACEAIAEAHALGIVHRDLKPANLFVVRRADDRLAVKVLDFGISKLTGASSSSGDASITKTSSLMGSPLYMSPEQMQSSKNVDTRSDIWALGVILYELLAGSAPFGGETMPELILQIMTAPPRALRDFRPDAPAGLEEVVLKCLDKNRGRRFTTVAELAVALLPFAPKRARSSVERISGVMRAAGLSATALGLPPSSDGGVPNPKAATTGAWAQTTPGGGTSGVAIAIGFGVLAVIAVAGVTFAVRRPSDAATAEASTPAVIPAPPPPASAPIATSTTVAPDVAPAQASSRPPPPSNSATTPIAVATAVISRRAPAPMTKSAASPATATPRAPIPPPPPAPVVTPAPAPAKKPTTSSLIDDRY